MRLHACTHTPCPKELLDKVHKGLEKNVIPIFTDGGQRVDQLNELPRDTKDVCGREGD